MATLVTVSQEPILQFLDNNGAPLVGGQLTTLVGGIPYPTYSEPTGTFALPNPIILNSRGEVATNAGTSSPLYVSPNVAYTFILQDSNGVTIWTAPNILAAATTATVLSLLTPNVIGAAINAVTPAETSAGIIPTNFQYPAGDIRRYGGDPTGNNDSSTAWAQAVATGYVIVPQGCTFQIVTGTTYTGTLTILGFGQTSKLLSDTTLVTVTNGSNSLVDNVYLGNITDPWVITRNPGNWALVPTLVKSSSVLGYQPSSNDYDIWPSLTTAQQTQQIGPVLLFKGVASGIEVSRVFGVFVQIIIMDATDSQIHDCDFRGGKGVFGAIQFDNCSNGIQRGSANRAVNNRVYYASFSGVIFLANDDFTMRGNVCYLCGESGQQTAQAGGVTFTASVGLGVGGTLTSGWSGVSGTWSLGFPNNEVRTCTLTNGSTAVSWTPNLPAGNLVNASVWGTLGSPSSTIDPRCTRGQLVDNRAWDCFFDAQDFLSTYGTTNDSCQSRHQIHNNYGYRCRGDGLNLDGQFNSVVGNHYFFNGGFGIWGTCSYNEIVGNFLIDNNQGRTAAYAEILAVGALANNKIADNYIYGGPTQNCPGIAVTQSAINYVSDNIGVGTTFNNLGNIGQVASVVDGNIDNTTGASTFQSFAFEIQNNAGTLQHIFYSDTSNATGGLFSRVNGATSGGFTTTPTGTDSSTAMAAGAKIGSALTNAVWIDTAAQIQANAQMFGGISFNNTGTALNCQTMFQSININGVTRYRLTFQFTNAATGATFALNSANITSGKGIYVNFYGKLA